MIASHAMGPGEFSDIHNVGFVSQRISGTDGVSLEVAKWAEVLGRLGCECFYICGKSDRPAERSFVIDEADFHHSMIREIDRLAFGQLRRERPLSTAIHTLSMHIKERIYRALDEFEIDLVVAENALTIPLNIPLGIALTQVIVETGLPCIAHHHDFVWERDRFLVSAVDDYLSAAFPPPLPKVEHVVINSIAGEEFSRRTGLSYEVIPNVMDFNQPPAAVDAYASSFRETVGLAPDDVVVLQPTRVVRRKGIEHSIELVKRLDDARCRLVISHGIDDEGPDYPRRIRSFAQLLGVELVFAQRWISHERGVAEDGGRRFTIWDVYPQADLVTYPSTYEGFGNAFLEALYYKKPIVCNRYTTYRADIEPYGFRAIAMDGFVSEETVERVRHVLADEAYRDEMVEHNFRLARQFFSFDRLEQGLAAVLGRIRSRVR